jgi:hypothetical protein
MFGSNRTERLKSRFLLAIYKLIKTGFEGVTQHFQV